MKSGLFSGSITTKHGFEEINFPIHPLEMADVLELVDGENVLVQVNLESPWAFRDVAEGAEHPLFQLDGFAERLVSLTDDEYEKFSALIQMENRPLPLDRLNQLMFNATDVIILDEAMDFEQLGKFALDNNFVPAVACDLEITATAAKYLDFAAIGKEAHQDFNGAFTSRGYALLHGWPQLEKPGVPLPDTHKKLPDHTMEVKLRYLDDMTTWPLPYGMDELYSYYAPNFDHVSIEDMKCLIPMNPRYWNNQATTLEDLNQFAGQLCTIRNDKNLQLLKAALSATGSSSLQDAIVVADKLDCFCLSTDGDNPAEYAANYLAKQLPAKDMDRLRQVTDFHRLGYSLMEDKGLYYDGYGIVQRKDGQPIEGMDWLRDSLQEVKLE